MKKFEVNYKARADLFSEYDKLRAHKSPLSLILVIVGALFSVVLYPVLIYLNPFREINIVPFVIGSVIAFLGIFGGKIFVFRTKTHEKTALVQGKQVFSEDRMAFTPKLENSNAEYSDYAKIFETEKAFYLLRKSAPMQVVAKEDFVSGDPNEFSAFIQEKTGKKVDRVLFKKKTVIAIISSLVAIVILVGTVLGGMALQSAFKNQEKVFSVENFSITLTKGFEQVEIEGSEFHADSLTDSTEVDAAFYSHEYLKDAQDITLNNVEEFVSWYFKDIVTEKKEVTEASATENTIEYEVAAPHGTYYYLSGVIETEKGFWFIECHSENSNRKQDFAKWLDSVEAK